MVLWFFFALLVCSGLIGLVGFIVAIIKGYPLIDIVLAFTLFFGFLLVGIVLLLGLLLELEGVSQVVASITAGGLIASVSYFVYWRRRYNEFYEVTWKKSSELKPVDLLRYRSNPEHGFNSYYHPRDEDNLIERQIEENKHTLVVGHLLSGKTRSIYEVLIKIKKSPDIIIPRQQDINLERFCVPRRFRFWSKRILVLDDIHKFLLKYNNVHHLVNEFVKRNVVIIASCESGFEKQVNAILEREGVLSFKETIEISKITKEEAVEVANRTCRELSDTFNGYIGSIFLPLSEMETRYKECTALEEGVLRSIKRLYFGGIQHNRELFNIEHIKRLSREKEEINLESYEWNALFKNLQNKNFIKIHDAYQIWVEEAYLKFIFEGNYSLIDNLSDLQEIFSRDSEALMRIGIRAYLLGYDFFQMEQENYLQVAIEAFCKAINQFSTGKSKNEIAISQMYMGSAYAALAEVRNKRENCQQAIEAFKKALETWDPKRNSVDYAMTVNNIGNTYRILAETSEEDEKVENANKAIESFEKALTIWLPDQYPSKYASTMNNLGIAYGVLASATEEIENCQRAIEAYKKALEIRTPNKYPSEFANTQNNLGSVYLTLAFSMQNKESRSAYCQLAIEALTKALEIWVIEKYPVKYAIAKGNLSYGYYLLAGLEEKEINCKLGIDACVEALRVFDPERFPEYYKKVRGHLNLLIEFCGMKSVRNGISN